MATVSTLAIVSTELLHFPPVMHTPAWPQYPAIVYTELLAYGAVNHCIFHPSVMHVITTAAAHIVHHGHSIILWP